MREISLLGQNVNGYRGETFDGKICTFADLLRLVAEIPGIGRIRYTTSHPLEFNDDLIQCYRDLPQMVSHLHLPVQSGSNDVLQAMKRNHTIDVYIEKIEKLRKVRPDMHLSSDFIIGFPGETDENFEETYQFIQDLDFDHSYSFVYSKRPGTPAAELEDTTPEQVKKNVWPKCRTGLNNPVSVKRMPCSVQSNVYWLRKFLIKIRTFWSVQQTTPVMSPLLAMHRG